MLGINNSQNLGRCTKIYHGSLLSRQNGMSHNNIRPRKFGASYTLYVYMYICISLAWPDLSLLQLKLKQLFLARKFT